MLPSSGDQPDFPILLPAWSLPEAVASDEKLRVPGLIFLFSFLFVLFCFAFLSQGFSV